MQNDRTLSLSTVTATITTKVQVIWELSAGKLDDRTSVYSNHIHSSATDETMAFLDAHGVPFDKARDARQQASDYRRTANHAV